MADYSCMDSLIGITNSDCSCVVDGLSLDNLTEQWYKDSTSGLFLDELEGIVPLKAVDMSTECVNEMATFYYRARANAIMMLGDDVMAGLQKKYKQKNKNVSGKVGSTSFGNNLSITYPYAGIKLPTYGMIGGYIKVSSITTMMNATATFDILVYRIYRDAYDQVTLTNDAELIATIPVESLANAVKGNNLTTPVTLYLTEYPSDFYFVYQPSGFQPKANGSVCSSCGGGANLNGFASNVVGVSGNDINKVNSWQRSNFGNGLSLWIDAGCDTKTIICEAYNNNDAFQKVMARAVQFKAGELTHEYVSATGQINRYTMKDKEFVWGKRNHFKKEYNDRVAYLLQEIDVSLIGCYICNSKKVRRTGIAV